MLMKIHSSTNAFDVIDAKKRLSTNILLGVPCSHQYDCLLSQYDLHLDQVEQGEYDSGFACLVFAALKGILQKPREFFINEFGSYFGGAADQGNVESSEKEDTPLGLPEKQGYDILLKMVKHTDDLSFEEAMNRQGLFLDTRLGTHTSTRGRPEMTSSGLT